MSIQVFSPFRREVARHETGSQSVARRANRRKITLESLEQLTLLSGFTPAQISAVYGFGAVTFQSSSGTVAGNGAGQTIAIVDPYNDPNIALELQTFDQHFSISAPPSFTEVNQAGGANLPRSTGDSSSLLETALDVEWAHAMAPGANIVLVESNSLSNTDLLAAVNTARNLPGVSVVSMSWGGPEFAGETSFDSYFTTPSGHTGVTFVASSGDSGSSSGASWPAVSPNVIAVGGTTLTLNSSGQAVQTVWSGSGGGISRYETQPAYQHGVVTQTSTARAVPDVAYVADPNTGVSVYSASSGWTVVGGTSVGAPQFSALIAIIDQGLALKGIGSLDGSTQALPTIYAYSSTFTDVTSGSNGAYSASTGYDLATGLGTPNAVQLTNAILTSGVVTDSPTSTTPPVIPNPPPATPPTTPPSFPSQPPSTGSPTLPPDQPTQPVPQPPVTTPTFGSWFSHFRSHRSNARSGNFSYFGSSHANKFSWL